MAERPRRSVLWRLRRLGYVILVLGVVAIGGLWMALNTIDLPPAKRPIETTFVCDSTVKIGDCGFNTAMAKLSATEERVNVDYEDLPPVLVQAVLAGEDRKFFDHSGIDPMGIGRALYQSVLGDSQSQQGGSTITQQYVKQTYLTSERSFERKLKEAVLAVKLEGELDKRDILTRYLNEIYFGRGAYGVEAASREYFGIGVQNLTLHQAAYLAGLIRAPERADATRNPDEASRRRRSVLNGMVTEGFITQEQADEADSVPWVWEPVGPDGENQTMTIRARQAESSNLGDVKYAEDGSEYWMELVRQQLRARFGPAAETQGLRVYTTYDPPVQAEANNAVWNTLSNDSGPAGALVSVDSAGQVKAMVAGRDFETSKVNLAMGKAGGGSGRPPGSTFKPFALATFAEEGYSTDSLFRSPPTTQFPGVYIQPDKLWSPRNFEKADQGVLTVEEATWRSSNTVYAGIVNLVTPQALAEMANRVGITAKLNPDYSLVLGTNEVSVLDMASGYSTFARRGERRDPYIITRVETAAGKTLYDVATDLQPRQVISEEVADTVNSVLKGVMTNGTGTNADFGMVAAGKTGTTNDSKDAWFVGYTCHLTTAVWIGFPTPEKMTNSEGDDMSGGDVPARIWNKFMRQATDGDEACEFPAADAGDELVNQRLQGSRSTTTTTSPGSRRSTTTTTDSDGGGSSGGSATTTSTTTPQRSTTTAAPTTSTPPTTQAPTSAPTTAPD